MSKLTDILHEIVDHLDLSPAHRAELKDRIEEHAAPEPVAEPEPLADDTAADTPAKPAKGTTSATFKSDGA